MGARREGAAGREREPEHLHGRYRKGPAARLRYALMDRGTSSRRLARAFADYAYSGTLLALAAATVWLWCVCDALTGWARSEG